MPNKTYVKVTYDRNNPTKPYHDAPTHPDPTVMDKGDTITIRLNRFLRFSTIDKIKINKNNVNTHSKGALLGSWKRIGGNETRLKGYFLCFVDHKKSRVVIVDTEDNKYGDDHKYWYSVSGTLGDTQKTWSIDPEVGNRGNG